MIVLLAWCTKSGVLLTGNACQCSCKTNEFGIATASM